MFSGAEHSEKVLIETTAPSPPEAAAEVAKQATWGSINPGSLLRLPMRRVVLFWDLFHLPVTCNVKAEAAGIH